VVAIGHELLCRVQVHFLLLANYKCANTIMNLTRGKADLRD